MTIIDVDITVSADDGSHVGTTFSNSAESIEAGNSSTGIREIYFRFTGISGLSGATINSAGVNWATRSTELGTMIAEVGVKGGEAAPAAPTDDTEFLADIAAITTAVTAFTSYTHTSDGSHMGSAVDIQSAVDEIKGLDPSVIMPLVVDNGSASDDNDYGRFRSTDRGGATDPNILIDLTAGGVTTRRYMRTLLGVG